MKSMAQMQNELYQEWVNAPKDKDGYPRLVCGFPGVVAMVNNKKEEDMLNRMPIFGVIGGVVLSAIIFGFVT